MGTYSRPLIDIKLVDHFLFEVLGFEPQPGEERINFKILTGEKGLVDYEQPGVQTLTFDNNRVAEFRSEPDRWKLRKQIIEELFALKRLDDDEDIRLGTGGALPLTGIKSDYKAYFVIGLPASGKSGICNQIADDNNAIILDSDYAKRKLPEFHELPWGASLVHSESSQIITGFNPNPNKILALQTKSIVHGYNIVVPTIGQDPERLITVAMELNGIGYEVHLTLISLPRREATIRAIRRYKKTDRYVPLGLIFDDYGNDPSLTYYLLKCKRPELFKSFGAISTNVTLSEKYYSIDLEGDNPAKIFDLKKELLF
ncbi:zeta toxin family protein [Parapedobacter koreensis]|uniref:Zeta toxin n=1 Tax=Parapedobacter koreensis TaxID=332977 RepID=A0A1H7UBU7_9SPHI|nr:zeta toxin family protein [Parapedobacter koreensis]SEL94155.1 Zeta toxin [Parapedobacter koreensis]